MINIVNYEVKQNNYKQGLDGKVSLKKNGTKLPSYCSAPMKEYSLINRYLVNFKGSSSFKVCSFQNADLNNININNFDNSTANLLKLSSADITVNPGFVIEKFNDTNSSEEVKKQINNLETELKKKFGDSSNPLILNVKNKEKQVYIGFNADTAKSMLFLSGQNDENEKYVYDLYSRAIKSYGISVLDIDPEKFNKTLSDIQKKHQNNNYAYLSGNIVKNEVISAYKQLIKEETGKDFPEDSETQLVQTIEKFRTNIIVESVNFNDTKHTSSMGIINTRDLQSGKSVINGYFLDKKTGYYLLDGKTRLKEINALEKLNPQIYNNLIEYSKKIEALFKEPQCIHFNITNGKLYISSAHKLDESPQAKIKSTVDMCKTGLITKTDAINKITADDLDKTLFEEFDPQDKNKAIQENRLFISGIGASTGVACGKAVFDTEKAKDMLQKGEKIILVKNETNADDVAAIMNSEGIIAINSGSSSHAVVVAKGSGKPCIVGCQNVVIDEHLGYIKTDNKIIKEGDLISIDGKTGEIIEGGLKTIQNKPFKEVFDLLNWADEISKIQVLANADTPKDVDFAVQMGARGIGLCRTEHMFFNNERLPFVRKIILTENGSKERENALNELEKLQYIDFVEIFKKAEGKPVTIRLLDMPLDEFLPDSKELISKISYLKAVSEYAQLTKAQEEELHNAKQLLSQVQKVEETNPMMGNRGSRFGIANPDVYKMQTRAVVKAYMQVNCKPKIMLPMISTEEEFKYLSNIIRETIKETLAESFESKTDIENLSNDFKIGPMLEIPDAVSNADELAKDADFFSIGSNDLTQFLLGLSRNDSEKTLKVYQEKGIIKDNPFTVLYPGVIKFMQQGISSARNIKPNIEFSLCGEQGSNNKSIENSYNAGVNYVSVSPAKIATTRLLAAQRTQKPREAGKIVFTGLNSNFKVQNDRNQEQLKIIDDITREEFKKSLENLSKQTLFTVDEIKQELKDEYSENILNRVNLSGEKAGFNSVILLIPGINVSNGQIPGIFPVITDEPDLSSMGGGHWRTQESLLNSIMPKIQEQIPEFSFEEFKKALGITTDTQRKNPNNPYLLPVGISLSNTNWTNSDDFKAQNGTFDKDGKPSTVSLHGFLIYDDQGNKYIIIDDKPGIEKFVRKNRFLFEDLIREYNLKDVLVGNIPINKQLSDQKVRNDFINQMSGQLRLSGYQSSEFKDSNSVKDLNTYDLIEILTNPNKNLEVEK